MPLLVSVVAASLVLGWFLGYLRSAVVILAAAGLVFAYAMITNDESQAGPDAGDVSVAEAIVLVDMICGLLAVVCTQLGAFLAAKHRRTRGTEDRSSR